MDHQVIVGAAKVNRGEVGTTCTVVFALLLVAACAYTLDSKLNYPLVQAQFRTLMIYPAAFLCVPVLFAILVATFLKWRDYSRKVLLLRYGLILFSFVVFGITCLFM